KFRLNSIDRIAESPTADRPPALRCLATQARLALSTGRNGSHEDSLPQTVARNAGSQFVNYAHRLVADDSTGLDGILSFDDVDVGPADGRETNLNPRLALSCPGDRLLFQSELPWAAKDIGLHQTAGSLFRFPLL